MGKKNKRPRYTNAPKPTKAPKVKEEPAAFRGGVLAWRFNAVDKGGPFNWLNLNDPQEYKETVEKLADFETMSEPQLGNSGCHFIKVQHLSKPATDRLVQLKLDDIDQVYSLRITGGKRIICIHRNQYMRVLWYDPDHLVCPAKIKHT